VKDAIARRAARLLQPGWVVNLGVGIPTLVAKYIDDSVHLHTEGGLLGVGPPPAPGEVDPNLINASKLPVTQRPGASFFDSAASFGMIRGGHVDAAVLGALQVDERGLIANWAVPGAPVLGVGGAMDLLVGVRNVVVVMTHATKEGEPKIVPACTLSLSSVRPAQWIVTELATFRVDAEGLELVECAPGVAPAEVCAKTSARYRTAAGLR
jgi:3-oxoacid CoA-transferase B subunit